MAEKVEIQIKAKDEATETIDKVGKALGTTLKIGLAGVAVGATAMAGALAFSVKEAMAAQEVQAQLDAVLKSTGGAAGMTSDAVNELATQLSQTTRYEDDAIVAGESMLLTFTNIGSNVFPAATQAILDMSTATGQDLQGSAIQLGKALNDPIAGISALSRVGVTFTEDQKKMITGMVEAGNIEQAQTVILQELQKEFGGSAVAAGSTLAGQMDILKNAVGNVAEGVGTALLPMLNDLLTKYIVPLLPKIQEFADKFTTQIVPAIGNFLAKLQPVIGFLRDNWMPIMAAVVAGLAVYVYTVVVPAFVAWAAAAWATATATIAAMAPIMIPILAIAAVVGLLALAWKNNWGGIQEKLTAVWAVVQPILQTIWEWLGVVLTAAIQKLTDFWNNVLLPALETFWAWIQTVVFPLLEKLWDWLGTQLTLAIQDLTNFWNNVLLPAIRKIWAFIQDHLIPLFEALARLFGAVVGVAITVLTALWNNVLLPALQGIWNFIAANLQPVFSALADFFNNTLVPAGRAVSDWFTNTLMPAVTKVADFIKGVFTAAWQGLTDFFNNTLKPAFEKVSNFLGETFGPAFQTISDFISGAVTTAFNNFKRIVDTVKDAFNGIGSAISGVIGWINDMITKLQNIRLPDWLQPGSPTPFEIGLRGISDAMKEISTVGLPSITAKLTQMPAPAYAASNGREVSRLTQQRTTINQFAIHLASTGQADRDVIASVRLMELLYG